MGNPIEAAYHGIEERTRDPHRDYLGSVLARASGVYSFQKSVRFLEAISKPWIGTT